ncbi:hypothetical protein MRB53_007339 [Persea americana]|uniref:Uncharacterized protein n=1 Tax=Persea americana TaxID=3435 RepID=A0ACC2MJL2_PERAE|nr:hypothetical protein MRB53_007339 [Persea americana]
MQQMRLGADLWRSGFLIFSGEQVVSDQARCRSLAVCKSLMVAVERRGNAGIAAERGREEMMEGAKDDG